MRFMREKKANQESSTNFKATAKLSYYSRACEAQNFQRSCSYTWSRLKKIRKLYSAKGKWIDSNLRYEQKCMKPLQQKLCFNEKSLNQEPQLTRLDVLFEVSNDGVVTIISWRSRLRRREESPVEIRQNKKQKVDDVCADADNADVLQNGEEDVGQVDGDRGGHKE